MRHGRRGARAERCCITPTGPPWWRSRRALPGRGAQPRRRGSSRTRGCAPVRKNLAEGRQGREEHAQPVTDGAARPQHPLPRTRGGRYSPPGGRYPPRAAPPHLPPAQARPRAGRRAPGWGKGGTDARVAGHPPGEGAAGRRGARSRLPARGARGRPSSRPAAPSRRRPPLLSPAGGGAPWPTPCRGSRPAACPAPARGERGDPPGTVPGPRAGGWVRAGRREGSGVPGGAAGCPQPAAGAEEEEKEEEAAEEAGPPMRSWTAPRRAGGRSRLAPRAAHTHRCSSRAPQPLPCPQTWARCVRTFRIATQRRSSSQFSSRP